MTYCLQMFIVLSGTTFGLKLLGYETLIVPVTLGAIATALTDFDDRLSLRLRNLGLVMLLFLQSVACWNFCTSIKSGLHSGYHFLVPYLS